MNKVLRPILPKNLTVIKMKLLFTFFICFNSFSQINDTIYIKFNKDYEEMEKIQFTLSKESQPSFSYLIRQKEETYPYDNKFQFGHYNRNLAIRNKMGDDTPVVLYKPKSFLIGKKILNIKFFKTTSYIKIAKTFEKEDTWEQDVVIFLVDVDEIKNDSIVLREVKFSRPVKQ